MVLILMYIVSLSFFSLFVFFSISVLLCSYKSEYVGSFIKNKIIL
jgi:hypothetical protein